MQRNVVTPAEGGKISIELIAGKRVILTREQAEALANNIRDLLDKTGSTGDQLF